MRVTVFRSTDAEVMPQVVDAPEWEAMDEHEGQPLRGVELASLLRFPGGRAELYRFAAGGHFAMHAGTDVAFCQIVSGRGILALPGGREIAYEGPELCVFLPGSLHEWRSIAEDTLLSVCLVEQG